MIHNEVKIERGRDKAVDIKEKERVSLNLLFELFIIFFQNHDELTEMEKQSSNFHQYKIIGLCDLFLVNEIFWFSSM